MLDWNYTRDFHPEAFNKFESVTKFKFPGSFYRQLPVIEGGFPSEKCFTDSCNIKRRLKRILTFNPDTRGSIWTCLSDFIDSDKQYMPFAVDEENNCLCFENTDKDEKPVYLHDRRTRQYIFVSFSFPEFLLSLYGDEQSEKPDGKLPYPYNLIKEIESCYEEQNGKPLIDDHVDLTPRIVENLLKTLTNERELQIIILRYRDYYTLKEVGDKFGFTRERARQCIAHAIRSLSNSKLLLEYSHVTPDEYERLKEMEKFALYAKNVFIPTCGTFLSMFGESADMFKSVPVIALSDTSLSLRTKNALMRVDCFSLTDIINKFDTRKDLLSIPYFGANCEYELLKVIHGYGLRMKWEIPNS